MTTLPHPTLTPSDTIAAPEKLRRVGLSRSDPRLIQIILLATFNLLGQTVLQFPITPAQIIVGVVVACATEMLFALRKRTLLFPASAMISALSLGLLLRPGYYEVVGAHRTFILDPNNLWLHALAGFLAIASKQWITVRGKHIFNPTNLAIVVSVLLLPGQATITPGQWGAAIVLLFVVSNLGYLMTYRVRRFHLIGAFWGSYAIFHAAVLLIQHKPLYLWWGGVTSGAVLLFTFFMLTDPRTSPNSVRGRVVYGVLCSFLYAVLALLSAPMPLMLALIFACLLVPVINRRLGGEDQTWQVLARRNVASRRTPLRVPFGVSQRQQRLVSGGLLVALVGGIFPTRPVQDALEKASFPPSPMMNRIAAPIRPLVQALAPAEVHAADVITSTVEITDDGFVSPVITVTVGTAVNWINATNRVRRVVGDNGNGVNFSVYLPQISRQTPTNGAAGGVPAATRDGASAATQPQASLDSGDLTPAEAFQYLFTKPGTFSYADPNVPGQRGEVRVFSGRTTVRGRIQTSDRVPMAGIKVFIALDAANEISAITDASGAYELVGVPTGRQDISVQPPRGVYTDGKSYPFYNFFRLIPPGPVHVIERPTYLPPVMTNPVPVPAGKVVEVTNPQLFGTVLVADGDTIEWPGGTREQDKKLSIDPVPVDRAPSTLPTFMRPAMLITVQPAGMRFTRPAPITFPNRDRLPPGTKTDLWSMNHATGMFESLGTMTVSDDGLSLSTDPGVGLQGSSWHTTIPVIEGIDSDTTKDCVCHSPTNSATALRTGANYVDHKLAPYTSLDQQRAVTLLYDSDTLGVRNANTPNAPLVQQRVISVRIKMGSRVVRGSVVNAGTPPTVRSTFFLAGKEVKSHAYRGVSGWGAVGGTIDMVDAQGLPLPTGVYSTNLHIDYSFNGTTVSADVPGEAIARNEAGSPFGAGWSIKGLQRMTFSPGAYAAISEAGGLPQVFRFRPGDTGFTSPAGDFTVLTRGADGRFSRVYPDGRQVVFDVAGRMISDSDRNGNTTAYSYDNSGRLTQIVDPMGLVTKLTYSAAGRVQTITDPASRVTRFTHDAAGNLLSITDPDKGVTTYTYDTNQRLLTQRHPKTNTTTYTYDAAGRVRSVVFANGEQRQFRPGEAVNLAENLANMAPVPSVLKSSDVITDERGFKTEMVTDRFGYVIQTRDPLGRTFDYARTTDGLLASARYPDGTSFSYTYDSRGNLLSLGSSRLGAVRVTRDATWGQITSFTDRLGRTTRIELDNRGQPVKVTDPANNVVTMTRNARGQITSISDPLKRVTTFTYDALGNAATMTDPLGRVRRIQRDAAGNVTSFTDAAARVWAMAFDQMNRLTSVTDPNGGSSTSTYDPNGYLTKWTDPENRETSFTYDAMNRLTRLTDALGKQTTYAYDKAGNLTTMTDARGTTTDLTYDQIGRPLTLSAPGVAVNATYNSLDKPTTLTGNGLNMTMSYDGNFWQEPSQLSWKTTDGRPLNGSVSYDYRAGASAGASAREQTQTASSTLALDRTQTSTVAKPADLAPNAVAPRPADLAPDAIAPRPGEPAHAGADELVTPQDATGCGDISGTVTWSGNVALTCNVTVLPGATLTIQPGTVIDAARFTRLYVKGTLNATGTAANRITWRLQSGQSYAWDGIRFYGGSVGTVAYNTLSGSTYGIEAGRDSGAAAMTVDVTNTQITTDTQFTGERIGVYVWDTALRTFTGNTITSRGRPVYLVDGIAATTPLAGNQLPDGGRIHLGGTYSDGIAGDVTLPAYTYALEGDLTVPTGKTLTVQPGAIVDAHRYTRLYVRGTLNATGTAANRITWRLRSGQSYAWDGIRFYGGSAGTVAYNTLSGSTYGIEAGRDSGAAAMTVDVTNTQISTDTQFLGERIGVYVWDTALRTFTGNTLTSRGRPVYLVDGIAATTPLAGNQLPDGGRIHLGGTYSDGIAGNVTLPAYTYALEGDLTVPTGKTLTVQPGAIVDAHRYTRLYVRGTLNATGTAANRITWRLLTGQNNAWDGIRFYGGSAGTVAYNMISGSTYGIEAGRDSDTSAMTVDVTNTQISTDTQFSGERIGVYVWDTALRTFTGNTITSRGRPVYLVDGIAATTPLAGNQLPDGGRIHLGGTYSDGIAGDVTLPAYTYVLEGDLTVPTGKTLTVQPGAIVDAHRYTRLYVRGTLNATGTAANRITWRLLTGQNNAWDGIRFYGGSAGTVAYNMISGSTYGIEAGRDSNTSAMTVDVTNTQISTDTQFSGERIGLYVWNTALRAFTGNTITSRGRAVYLVDGTAATTPLAGNQFPGGGRIHLGGGTLADNVTLLAVYPHLLEGNLTIPAGKTLTVQAGMDLSFGRSAGINVAGTLRASGDMRRPILFHRDAASPNRWYGLSQSAGVIRLAYVAIDGADIGVNHNGGALTLDHVVVRGGDIGIRHSNGSTTLTNVGIEGNQRWGIQNVSPVSMDARNIWWGSASGPLHTLNPSGNGDKASDDIQYSTWNREAVVFQNFTGTPWSVQIATNGNDAQQIAYTYDTLDRLSSLRSKGAANYSLDFTYDAASQLTALTPVGSGVASKFEYDLGGQLTRLTQRSPDGAATFADTIYAYDKQGNVLKATAAEGATSYTYDARKQLLSVTRPGASAESYTYDKAGNRKTRNTGGTTTRYSYDAANQLLSSTDGWTYTYDAAGNLLTRTKGGQTDTFVWDGLSRLTRITYADGTYSAYTYDHYGRRLSKRDRTGTLRYYVYDGPNLVQELDGAGKLVASYVHGRTVDHPFSMTRDGVTYSYVYDRIGTVIGLTDGAGTVVTRYTYDAWGNQTISGAAIEQPFGFTGREWDADSGLYFYRARYYDPAVGRFISRDPVGLAGGPNLYMYAANNPVSNVDPTGNIVLAIVAVGVGIAVVYIAVSPMFDAAEKRRQAMDDWNPEDENSTQRLRDANNALDCAGQATSQGLNTVGMTGTSPGPMGPTESTIWTAASEAWSKFDNWKNGSNSTAYQGQ